MTPEKACTYKHYERMAQWLKEIGLVALTMLVVQPIIAEESLSRYVVLLGLLVAIGAYGVAYKYSLKAT